MNISKAIAVDLKKFIISKSGIRCEEIRDLSQTLREANLGSNSKIFVELGTPVSAGTYKVLLYEAVFNHEEDNELFKYSDLLFSLDVAKDASVREFKSQIAEEFSKLFMNGEELPRDRIRIREKATGRLGKIMRDGKHVSDYGICQNKTFAIQVLEYEEVLTDENEIMVVIRQWTPGNGFGTLSKKQEILLNKNHSRSELVESLVNYGFISPYVCGTDYEIAKVNSITKFMVEDLPNQPWKQLEFVSHWNTLSGDPFYIRTDGYLLLIRNPNDFKDIPIIQDQSLPIAANSFNDNNASKFDKFNIQSTAVHRIPFVGGGKSTQKGITIKVMDKEAQKEQEKKKKEEEEERKKKLEETDMDVDEDNKEELKSNKKKKTKTTTETQHQSIGVGGSDDVYEEMEVDPGVDLDFLDAFQ